MFWKEGMKKGNLNAAELENNVLAGFFRISQ